MANTPLDFRNVKSVGLNKNRLPDGYTEVEYLKSNPTAKYKTSGDFDKKFRIDTKVDNINGCRVKCRFDKQYSDAAVYGSRSYWDAPWFTCVLSAEDASFLICPDKTKIAGTMDIHFIDNNCRTPGWCYVDDTGHKLSYISQCSRTTWLFNDNCGATWDYSSHSTIYSAEFYRDQVLVCYPVPCVYHYGEADAKPGFYDLVNARFLTQEGLGELEYGPVVDITVDEIYVKEIETSTTTLLWKRPLE